MFLKLLRKAVEEYQFEKRISLTLPEFGNLVNTSEKILESVVQEKSAKDFSTKTPSNKKPKLQNESVGKDGGSNV